MTITNSHSQLSAENKQSTGKQYKYILRPYQSEQNTHQNVDAEADADADIDFDIATELEVLKRRRNYLDFDAHATCQRIPDKYEICILIKRDGRKRLEICEGQ